MHPTSRRPATCTHIASRGAGSRDPTPRRDGRFSARYRVGSTSSAACERSPTAQSLCSPRRRSLIGRGEEEERQQDEDETMFKTKTKTKTKIEDEDEDENENDGKLAT